MIVNVLSYSERIPKTKPKGEFRNIRYYECANPMCDNLVRIEPQKYNFYTKKLYPNYLGCSVACSQSEYVKTQLRGMINPFKTDAGQQKAKNRVKELYGVDNVFQSEIIKEKIRKTNIEKYGVPNPQQNTAISEATTKTLESRYELVGWANKETLEKTNMARYGASYYFSSDEGRMNLDGYILRNGKKLGKELYKRHCERVSQAASIEAYIDRYGEIEGPIKRDEWISKATDYLGRLLKKYDVNTANEIYDVYVKTNVRKSLKAQGGKSGLNKRIGEILSSMGIRYEEEYYLKGGESRYFFDFFLIDHNVMIEVQGDYWHANPKIYEANDIISYPGGLKKSATEMWKKDAKKRAALPDNIKLIEIWESEMNKSTNYELIQLILEGVENV